MTEDVKPTRKPKTEAETPKMATVFVPKTKSLETRQEKKDGKTVHILQVQIGSALGPTEKYDIICNQSVEVPAHVATVVNQYLASLAKEPA